MRVHPALRRRALYQSAMFGAFSAFWTTISFVLTSPPFDYNQGQVGLFVNTVVLRTDLADVATVPDLLRRTNARAIAAQKHQHAPFDRVVAAVQPVRDPDRNVIELSSD